MYCNVTNLATQPPFNYSSNFYGENVATSVLLALISPVAVAGNALVLAAIWRNPSFRTPSYIFLAGLAITDFCTGLIVLPTSVAKGLIYLTDPHMNLFDKNNWPTSYLITRVIVDVSATYLFHVTILMTTLMSIERWLHMSRRSLVTVRRACFAVVMLLLTPIPLVVNIIQGTFSLTYAVISLSVLVFCLTTTSVAYFKVFRIIRRHQQQIQVSEFSQSMARPTINFAKYKKSVFTILYIVALFCISYLPIVISFVLLLNLPINEFIGPFVTVSVTLVFLSSSLNPLLYLWRMKDIRNEVRQLVGRLSCL
ncbi:adenosine receptor A1-like isoform X2 [Oculina patagonica]